MSLKLRAQVYVVHLAVFPHLDVFARGRTFGTFVGRLAAAVAAVRCGGNLRRGRHGLRTGDLDARGDR